MWVKMLDGRFAGEVKDLRSDVALEFIRQNRAERAFQDPAPVAAVAPSTAEAETFWTEGHDARTRLPKAAKADGKKPSK